MGRRWLSRAAGWGRLREPQLTQLPSKAEIAVRVRTFGVDH